MCTGFHRGAYAKVCIPHEIAHGEVCEGHITEYHFGNFLSLALATNVQMRERPMQHRKISLEGLQIAHEFEAQDSSCVSTGQKRSYLRDTELPVDQSWTRSD